MATTFLLDTNTITALAQGTVTALEHLRRLAPDDNICTCFVVLGEWEYGIRHAAGTKRQEEIRASGLPLFAALNAVWDSTRAIAIRYGSLSASLRANGQLIPTNDIWIAATALEHGATVVTTDRHFRRVPGLHVVDWLDLGSL